MDQCSYTDFERHDTPFVRASRPGSGRCLLVFGTLTDSGTENAAGTLSFPDPDTAREWLDMALSDVVGLCMTPDDRQAELFAEAQDAAS
jgi:hypothetical protein